MSRDYTIILWLLKLGALINLYFVVSSALRAFGGADEYVVVPAQILFAVSAYRCLFPVRYEHDVVFHDSMFSSIFVTRLLATFSEVAYIFLFSHVLRILNVHNVSWVTALSWIMVVQVVISQGFVWIAILTERFELYFYEELGWGLIFLMNTIGSGYLFLTASEVDGREILLKLNLLFGLVYLPWQVIHLTTLCANARRNPRTMSDGSSSLSTRLATGLRRAMRMKNRRTDANSWGGIVGLIWMTAYWATLIPMWTYYMVRVLGSG